MAYISAYKIIRDKTVVDPKDYVSDKREGEPSSFSEIRAIILHSRRRDEKISLKLVYAIRAKLPEYTREIIQRAATFIEDLASN